jgi:hypothetical protein
MRIESWVGVIASVMLLCGSVIAADPQECRRSPLPANVEFFPDSGRDVQRMYDRSPTFRSQCERIAKASNLRVRVYITTRIPASYRALTHLSREGRELRADVNVPPGVHFAEMLGHEFEHVLEQVDGVNLRRLAAVRGSGVWAVEKDLFESNRAQDAGRLVGLEVYRNGAKATD